MTVSKDRYLHIFGIVVILLALYRCARPEIAGDMREDNKEADSQQSVVKDTIHTSDITGPMPERHATTAQSGAAPSSKPTPHKIYSVPRFRDCFPDQQPVHIMAARQWGVKAVKDRKEAERRKNELVYIAANPYFHIDKLNNSIPYLVPRAANLLNDIGRQYFDSLYVKDIPLHKIIVTSVLRTEEDVDRLRRRNGNATENSCHLYGTTFDVCYNRYVTVYDPRKGQRRAVTNDTLKWVLAEVLRDIRLANRAYVKYEVKQGCFHITVR
ncbi:MAG: DUF5715 family protein [Prevotella sp.]